MLPPENGAPALKPIRRNTQSGQCIGPQNTELPRTTSGILRLALPGIQMLALMGNGEKRKKGNRAGRWTEQVKPISRKLQGNRPAPTTLFQARQGRKSTPIHVRNGIRHPRPTIQRPSRGLLLVFPNRFGRKRLCWRLVGFSQPASARFLIPSLAVGLSGGRTETCDYHEARMFDVASWIAGGSSRSPGLLGGFL